MNIRHLIATAALAALSAASFAQTPPPPTGGPATPSAGGTGTPERGTNTPKIDQHMANQEQRIKQGRQSGELTKAEAHRLKTKEKSVQRAKAKAAADGTVTQEERSQIRQKQDRVGQDIYKQKHDAASAPAK